MILDLIEKRYSLRNFSNKMPSFDDIRTVLEAGRLAPSFLNVQPWHFIVVKDDNMKKLLYDLSGGQQHILQAPVIIVCCADLNAFGYENFRGILEKRIGMTQERLMYILTSKALNPALNGFEAVKNRGIEEITYAVSYMTLAAAELGLDTCIIGGIGNEYTGINQDVYAIVKEELGLDRNICISSLLLVGYPNEDEVRPTKDRKDFEQIVSFEKYSCNNNEN